MPSVSSLTSLSGETPSLGRFPRLGQTVRTRGKPKMPRADFRRGTRLELLQTARHAKEILKPLIEKRLVQSLKPLSPGGDEW